jgi:DNA polymerase-3 subunit delta
MSSLSGEKAIAKALKELSFERAYYFHGADDFRKDEAVRLMVDAAVDPATRDFNLEIRRGGELDARTLASLLATPPMMAERRVLVVRDAGSLKKDAKQALERWLADPAPDSMVVVVSTAGDKAEKAFETKATTVEFAPLKDDKVVRWIERHARNVHGTEITPDAAQLLMAAAGQDLQQLAGELDKLASYARGGTIDEAAVSNVVGVRRGETLADFLDAVGRRDATRALALVDHVLAQPKTTGVNVVMALTVQTLALAWGAARRARGSNAGELAREYFGFLKEANGFVGRPWGEAVQKWLAVLDQWDLPSLDRALERLLEADLALKETRLSSESQLLSSLVLALCAAAPAPGGRRAA